MDDCGRQRDRHRIKAHYFRRSLSGSPSVAIGGVLCLTLALEIRVFHLRVLPSSSIPSVEVEARQRLMPGRGWGVEAGWRSGEG